ncbi:hypothetical protein Tco_1090604 [Tanacetum coccineum]|uniref:Reverse transcriptase domain-containing protein n=1 Tax=Tanacetum coccineum TaxID=301880 RepID=A0ABQ5I4N2_9ASTR
MVVGESSQQPVKETTLTFQCPILTSTNYTIWRMRIEVLLGIHEEAIKTRNLGDDRVKKARLPTLITEFKNLKMLYNDTIDEYAAKLSGIASKSATLGEAMSEHKLVKKFLTKDVEPEPNLPLQEIIILDPDDQPIWESAKNVAPTPNSAIIQLDVDDNFVINSTHLNMIRENKFDGYLRADPHDHICEFLAICNMFKYVKTQSEYVKLLIFPYSLSDKAKT